MKCKIPKRKIVEFRITQFGFKDYLGVFISSLSSSEASFQTDSSLKIALFSDFRGPCMCMQDAISQLFASLHHLSFSFEKNFVFYKGLTLSLERGAHS